MTRFRAVYILLILVIIGLIILAGAYGHVISQVNANQQTDTDALCHLRSDLQNRVSAGNSFLLKNPHGIPGIPAPTLRASINGQQHTINALSTIHCS